VRFAVHQQADGDAPVVQAVDEAGGAVDGVDDPDAACLETGRAALLAEKAVFGKTFGEPPANEVLDALVGDADHVLAIAALVLHIQCLALTVIGHAELRSFQRKALGAGIAGVDVEVAHGGFPGQKRHSRRT